MQAILYSSASDNWSTPQNVYDELNEEFHFDLDPAASEENHKCSEYYTVENDGLSQDWSGHTVWLNPPYGKTIGLWIRKAMESDCDCVMLLPARTDTRWFHEYIYGKCELRFIKGHLKFGGSKNSAPFPSMICVKRRME